MNPDIWGKPKWTSLHLVTKAYPLYPSPEKKKAYRDYFLQLTEVLPCSICGDHYRENLKVLPLTDKVMESRESLMDWLIDMHNLVNQQTGKNVLTRKEAYEAIDRMASRELVWTQVPRRSKNSWLGCGVIFLLVILVIVVSFWLSTKCKKREAILGVF